MLQIPLYLAEFLRVYENTQQIPESTTILTGKFLDLKYKREKNINMEFDKNIFRNVMYEYVCKIGDSFGMKNPQIPQQKSIDILRPFLENTKMAPIDFLKYAVSMNILLYHKQDNTYSFAHQSYQDFYIVDEA